MGQPVLRGVVTSLFCVVYDYIAISSKGNRVNIPELDLEYRGNSYLLHDVLLVRGKSYLFFLTADYTTK
jgi:hypothetical protein